MSLKFAANLNFLFTEGSPNIVEKIQMAARAGFRAVEIPFVLEYKNQVIKTIESTENMQVALINIACSEKHKFGCASIPGAENEFRQSLTETIDFAKAVKCNKIHLMAGTMTGEGSCEAHLQTYKSNLKYAASCLEKENLIGLIEPINKYALPAYFMNCYKTAATILEEINSNNLKLMLDIFHLQHIQGNITNTFKELSHRIGHIQIAQVPHRHEPDVEGELDFNYVFHLLKNDAKYAGWIGCEYVPKKGTVEGLKWLTKFGFEL